MIFRMIVLIFLTTPVFANINSDDISRLNTDILAAKVNNYEQLSVYFTDQGWQDFSKSLLESGNLDLFQSKNIDIIVNFLGVDNQVKTSDGYMVTSHVMVTYHNQETYQSITYQTVMSFYDINHQYKINDIKIKPMTTLSTGQMVPKCPLKEL